MPKISLELLPRTRRHDVATTCADVSTSANAWESPESSRHLIFEGCRRKRPLLSIEMQERRGLRPVSRYLDFIINRNRLGTVLCNCHCRVEGFRIGCIEKTTVMRNIYLLERKGWIQSSTVEGQALQTAHHS